MPAPAETPTAVIDRISLVLDTFDGPGRLTLAQIVRRTGLPRSSAHRMLERLVQLRWLRRSGRDYELGMRLVELGSLAVHQDRLVRAAGPLLGELHRATGLVVHLAVLDGPDVVYLEKVGDRLNSVIPSRVGAVSRRTVRPSARRSWLTATRRPTSTWGLARPNTRFPAPRNWRPNSPRSGRTASLSNAKNPCSGLAVSQLQSAVPAKLPQPCRCAVRCSAWRSTSGWQRRYG